MKDLPDDPFCDQILFDFSKRLKARAQETRRVVDSLLETENLLNSVNLGTPTYVAAEDDNSEGSSGEGEQELLLKSISTLRSELELTSLKEAEQRKVNKALTNELAQKNLDLMEVQEELTEQRSRNLESEQRVKTADLVREELERHTAEYRRKLSQVTVLRREVETRTQFLERYFATMNTALAQAEQRCEDAVRERDELERSHMRGQQGTDPLSSSLSVALKSAQRRLAAQQTTIISLENEKAMLIQSLNSVQQIHRHVADERGQTGSSLPPNQDGDDIELVRTDEADAAVLPSMEDNKSVPMDASNRSPSHSHSGGGEDSGEVVAVTDGQSADDQEQPESSTRVSESPPTTGSFSGVHTSKVDDDDDACIVIPMVIPQDESEPSDMNDSNDVSPPTL